MKEKESVLVPAKISLQRTVKYYPQKRKIYYFSKIKLNVPISSKEHSER